MSNNHLNDVDELFPEAVRVCVEAGKASASLIQRRLDIGYARAVKLMDQLTKAGLISEQDGSKPREVLVTDKLVSYGKRK